MRAWMCFLLLFSSTGCLWGARVATDVEARKKFRTNSDRFMTRAESKKERTQPPKHAQFWEKMIAEREKQRAAQAPAAANVSETSDAPARVPIEKATVVALFDMDGTKSDFDAQTLEALTEYFAMRLAASRTISLVPRGEVRTLLEEQKADSYRACYDESCRIELGKELAAEKSISPKILRTGDHCVIGAVIYDLKNEIAEHAASSRTACGEEALLDAVDRVAAELQR